MFENHAIKLINRQLSWLTGSLTCLRAFTRFYALLRAFTRFYALLRNLQFSKLSSSGLHSFQGYTVFKFYPLSLRYRDPAASPLNARQYMFENHAIKLINRQLSWLTGSLTCLRAFTRFYALLSQLSSLTCLRAFTRFYALLRAFTQFSKLSSLQFTPFTVYSINMFENRAIKLINSQ